MEDKILHLKTQAEESVQEYKKYFPFDHFTWGPQLQVVNDSLSFDYFFGVPLTHWGPHEDRIWRVMPCATIVAMGKSDARYFFEIKDEGRFDVGADTAVVIPAGKAFRFTMLDPTDCMGNAHISFTILGHIDVLSFFSVPYLIRSQDAVRLGGLISELANLRLDRRGGLDLRGLIHFKYLAFSILDLIIANSQVRQDRLQMLGNLSRIEAVLHYMNAHITENMSRKTLADIVHLSETRFHYVFKEITGFSPMNYLTTLRLQKAQENLLSTDKSVTEIAAEVGIPDVFYFSRIFKNKFKMSPTHYRQIGLRYNVSRGGDAPLPRH